MSLEKTKQDIMRPDGISKVRSTEVVDSTLSALKTWLEQLAKTSGQNTEMPKALGFWFVAELQKNVDPAISLPDLLFTINSRHASNTKNSDATFYELLCLFYKIGAGFIREEGVKSFEKLYR